MRDVWNGFVTIWVVIGVGWVLAHRRVLDEKAQQALARLAFSVASPALLFTILLRADTAHLFSGHLRVTIMATVLTGLVHLLIAGVVLRSRGATLVVGTASACYVNANNLGLPIAAYVLKDVTWVAPLLLFQVCLAQPFFLTLLDLDAARAQGRRARWWLNLTIPLRNPMTVATLAGLGVNLAGWHLPIVLTQPLDLLGALSVPAMLIAFGISLRLGPLPGRGEAQADTVLASILKLLVHPAIAWALAAGFGLDRVSTLGVVVLAGLPTAQNVFVWASRYERGLTLARDVIFVTTIASVATIAVSAGLVHG